MRLDEPWFEAEFVARSSVTGHYCQGPRIDGADGLFLWCPCGYGKPEYALEAGRPHGVLVSFANPRNAPPVPANAGTRDRSGKPSRWTMTGTGLSDLTLSPSIDLTMPNDNHRCWHGWIRNGIIT